MKKLIILVLGMWSVLAHAQTVGQFRYDTTKFLKVGGYNEVKIQNATMDSVGGIFTNVGKGWGKWLRPRAVSGGIIIGLDTIPVSGGSGVTVTSYGKNASLDSTILLLSDGTRYAAKDSVGSGGVGSDTLKVSVSDTAAMLAPYLNKNTNRAAYSLFGNRTASIAAPNFFLNPYIDSFKISTDTLFGRVNGSWVFQAKSSVFNQWQSNGADIYFNTGNVGIGTNTPTSLLNLVGDISTNGFSLDNVNPATAGSPSNPFSINFSGYGWKTVGGLSLLNKGAISFISTSSTTATSVFTFSGDNNSGSLSTWLTLAQYLATFSGQGRFGNTYINSNGIQTGDPRFYLNNSTSSGYNADLFVYNQASSIMRGNVVTGIDHDFRGGHGPAASSTSNFTFARFNSVENWGASSTGSYTIMSINATETSIPSGQNYLFKAGTGGTSKFDITNTGQVQVGAGTPVASRILDVSSTTQASSPFPVMTAAQKTAISSPTVGDHIYQSDGTEGVYVYKSSGWAFAY